jgi:hypothetical protein
LKSIAAVRAKTMQTTTRNRIFNDGQPFAATISAPSANGSAKIVCEKRISRRNRAIAPLPSRFINIAKEFLQKAAKKTKKVVWLVAHETREIHEWRERLGAG